MTTFAHGTPDRVPIDYFANGNIDRRLSEYFEVGPGQWVGEALGVALGPKIPDGTEVLLMPDGKAQALLHVLGAYGLSMISFLLLCAS